MLNAKDKQSEGLISNVFSIAKKLTTTSYNALNHIAPDSVATLSQAPNKDQIVEGYAREKDVLDKKPYENPQQMMRKHLPLVSSQLLGRHYKNINNVASFISPELNNKISDYFFEKLNTFISQTSSVDELLKDAGVKNLAELANDPARSQRVSQALANQNKLIAVAQGTLTGATGVIGSAIDVPTSIGLALRSIYQTGRAHGFELKPEDHAIVEYIFKQINIGSVAEKQALLIAVRTFANVVQTHDINQLQQILGSSNDAELLKKWLVTEDGSFKWSWLNHIPQIGVLSKLTPVASIGISAFYSWQLVDDASNTAQRIFSIARQYLIQHPEQDIDPLSAYEQAEKSLEQADLLLLENHVASQNNHLKNSPVENTAIKEIKIVEKNQVEVTEEDLSTSIHQGLKDLAETHIDDTPSQTAVPEPVIAKETSSKTKTNRAARKPTQKQPVSMEQAENIAKDDEKVVTKRRAPRKLSETNPKTIENTDKK